MICPHCGQANGLGVAACDSCHQPLPTASKSVATGVLTPVPPTRPGHVNEADARTYLPTSADSPTFAADPPPSTAGRMPAAPRRVGPLNPGQSFGPRYHIIRVLGAGGMGAVYQAWDEELGVAVAIKVVLPEIAADPERADDVER